MYDTYYINELSQPVCGECAQMHEFELINEVVNWENEELYCDDCSNQIHSQYGDDNEIYEEAIKEIKYEKIKQVA